MYRLVGILHGQALDVNADPLPMGCEAESSGIGSIIKGW
jgi:hypothetical protein